MQREEQMKPNRLSLSLSVRHGADDMMVFAQRRNQTAGLQGEKVQSSDFNVEMQHHTQILYNETL